MKTRLRKGLSLVELMVTIGITVIIGGILARFLIIGGSTWHSGDAAIQAAQEARKGMTAMTRELRQASYSSLTDMSGTAYQYTTDLLIPINYNSVVFRVVTVISGNNNYGAYGCAVSNTGVTNWSVPITYYVNNGQLIRLQGGTVKVLANNVTGLQFCLRDASYIMSAKTIPVRTLLITFQTTKTTAEGRQIPMTLTSSILLRN